MQYFPIFAKLDNKPVTIVGGGDVAMRKASAMLKANALVTLIAPDFCEELIELENKGKVTLKHAKFSEELIEQPSLIIAATDIDEVNQEVEKVAIAKNIFVNVVDDQQKCSFIFPSIVDRNPITIAISSAGTAPVLARKIRTQLEVSIPQYIGPLAALAGRFRSKVKDTINSFSKRRYFWEDVFNSSIVSDVEKGNIHDAEEKLNLMLEQQDTQDGEVFVVGAGPGDPELLTIKALQAMQQADVIVYDYLVSQEIMDLARKDADFICVGKRLGNHSVPQQETNKVLVELARQGKKVCRLKGGDPFIYGRGGEEVQELAKHGISFQIVPGITAAAGCAAYAGIPLTHRDHAQAIQFVTGHCKKDGQELDWESLAKPHQTLAVYMGVIKSPHIQAQLIAHGRSEQTPIAIIENGTRETQRVVTGKLENLATLIETHSIKSPALLIIGEVAQLHQQLNWYKQANGEEPPLNKVA